MAKRIKLDFSKTNDRSGWNTKHIPEGLYAARITHVEETKAKDGTPMLIYGFQPNENKYKTRSFPVYCKLQANQLWKLRDLLMAAGYEVPKKVTTIDPDKIVGKTVAIEVEDNVYNGNVNSQVSNIYDLSLVEDIDEDQELGDEEDDDFDEDDFEADLDEDDEDFDDLEDDDLDEDFEEEDLDEEEETPKKSKKSKK